MSLFGERVYGFETNSALGKLLIVIGVNGRVMLLDQKAE